LYQYLHNKGLNIQSGSISVLDDYIGKNFSFIASWITPTANSSQLTKVTILQRLQDYFTRTNDINPDGTAKYPMLSNFISQFENTHPYSRDPHDIDFKSIYDYQNYMSWQYVQDHPQIEDELVQALQNNPSVIITNADTATIQQTSNIQKSFYVTFPTSKIYYPLLPETVYGSMSMPLSISRNWLCFA